MSNEQEEWLKQYDAFHAAHKDCPEAKDIPCLNLIMKKEYALQILNGTKKVEFRAFSPHYCDRLFDKDVLAYIDKHADDEVISAEVGNFITPMRIVQKIHFHNYNNSWFLDVECEMNGTVAVVPDDVKFLNEEYNCHDLDDMLRDMTNAKEQNRPIFFYLVCGKVIDTNLK